MSRQITVSLGPTPSSAQQNSTDALLFGNLYFDQIRNEEISSFEYAGSWLSSANDWFFDPDISFFAGRQYPSSGKTVFDMISDSCPDRWGRTLMQRSESRKAANEQRPVRQLNESDFLLGVNDASRLGALRFSHSMDALKQQGAHIPHQAF